jgi:succinoglycan biosynthesis transport protein ExoP
MATNRAVMALGLPAENESFAERFASLSRHKRLVGLVAAVAVLASILLALLLPPTYQASATILIEQQEIPQDLVRSTITSFADQRIQVISQRVMTTQNLLQIIERYDLYPDIRKSKTREVLLKRMRDDVHMSMIGADVIDPRSGRPTRANIAFTVAYENRSADIAYKVANELTTLYLNENATSRAKQAEQAASFLKEEADRLSAQIADVDVRLAAFKAKHSDRLPELNQLNLSVVDRTDTELRDVGNRLGTLDQQRLLMEAQLAQLHPASAMVSDGGVRILSPEERLKMLRSQLASLSARYAPDHPDVLSAQREIEGLERQVTAEADVNDLTRQLEDARGRLAAAQKRYAPEHPDVKRLERTVASLEAAIAVLPRDTHRPVPTPDNPAYIQVKGNLDALLAERDTLLKKQRDLGAKLGDYETRLAKAPEVEREYRALMRDSENARLKYQDVRSKQMEAQVSQNLETERKGERFTLIEPPLPPEQPTSPKRGLILGLGIVLSGGLGIGAGLAKEGLGGAVRGPIDLRRLVEVAPLAAVPTIVTSGERQARRRRWLWSSLGSALALIVAVVSVHFLVMPLEVVWAVVARRFGV